MRHTVAIIVAVALGAGARAGAQPDAGTPPIDAGTPPIDARTEVSADAAVAVSAKDLSARLAALTAKRDALQSLLSGKLPDDLYTTELFAIDLHDEPTVERRRNELSARFAGQEAIATNGPVDAGVAVTPDAGPRDAGTIAIDGAGELPATEQIASLEREISTRELDVDRLRLAFLALPLDRRTAVLEAEETARRNAVERAAADEELVRAEAEQHRAEEAQRVALAQAEQSREAMQRLLANERARIEGARASLAEQRAILSRSRTKRLADATTAHALVFSLTDTARTVAPGAEADALYDRVVAEVEAARDRLSSSLDRLDTTAEPATFEMSAAVRDSNDPVLLRGRAELANAATEIDTAGRKLAADRSAVEWQLAQSEAADAEDLNEVRIGLLDRLSSDKRDRTLGFGDEGRDQLRRELQHLTLLARWTWRSKLPAVRAAVTSLTDPNVLIWFLARLLGIALLVAGARWSIRRGQKRLETLPRVIVREVRRPIVSRLALIVTGALNAVWSPLIVVLVLWLIGKVGGLAVASPLVSVPYGLVLAFAIYRLIVAGTYQAIQRLQGKGTIWSPELSERVLRSVHFVGRIVFAFFVLSRISGAILGRGYLYHLVIRVAVLGALPLALILFGRWRRDIVDAYLKRRPDGLLARLVKSSRERWYGFFLALAAFALVLVQWVINGARRFALSFDQTRKALAYLFRRRLERRSGDSASQAIAELPPEVCAAVAPRGMPETQLLAPLFPELDEFRADVEAWQIERDRVGSWLVVGKSGMGKTTWLHGAAIASGLPIVRIVPLVRISKPDELLVQIGTALGVDAHDEAAIISTLRDGPRRLLVLDDAQRLALRGVGQLAAWQQLCRIVERTHDRVYWLAACGFYADEFLGWTRRGPSAFRRTTKLARWTEPQIQTLLETRIAATGWRVSYDDLTTIQVDPSQRAITLANTAREYARLIWDYSEGAPRSALDCWARSLVPTEGNVVRVRLFARPAERQLDQLDEVSRLILAALIWHEQLSITHAVTVLRFSLAQCDLAFQQLHTIGAIEHVEGGEYAVATAWWPAVTRYLTRKHLIET